MRKVVIFGNSGSGKSTLAKKISSTEEVAHLDLDTLAWLATVPPERKPLEDSKVDIEDFMRCNKSWVIEGCYTDLLEIALPDSNEIIFMNLPIELCIENACNRPWEKHKYESKTAQDQNLEMLINWISEYSERTDTFSEQSHKQLYEKYTAKKRMIIKNE